MSQPPPLFWPIFASLPACSVFHLLLRVCLRVFVSDVDLSSDLSCRAFPTSYCLHYNVPASLQMFLLTSQMWHSIRSPDGSTLSMQGHGWDQDAHCQHHSENSESPQASIHLQAITLRLAEVVKTLNTLWIFLMVHQPSGIWLSSQCWTPFQRKDMISLMEAAALRYFLQDTITLLSIYFLT